MNEDMMKEINDMRKLKAIIEKHADKVETIFMDVQKSFNDFNQMKGTMDEMQRIVKPVGNEIDSLKVKVAEGASKKEVSDLLGKFQEFEKHMSKVVDLLDKRTESAPKEMSAKFEMIEKDYTAKINEQLKKANEAAQIFKQLETNAPELFKKLKLDKVVEKVEVGKPDTSNPDVDAKKKEDSKELSKNEIFKGDEKAPPSQGGAAQPAPSSAPSSQPSQSAKPSAATSEKSASEPKPSGG